MAEKIENNISITEPIKDKTTIGRLEELLNYIPFLGKFIRTQFIAVIRFTGIISNGKGAINLETYHSILKQAFNSNKLVAVCLIINSPGGSPVQTDLLAQQIRALADKKEIPVYAIVEDIAASGGYWLACTADEIYASKSSLIGSIGVITRSFGFDKLLEKIGVERRVYSQGENKSFLDPFQAEKPTDSIKIQKLQQEVYEHFVNYIKSRRGHKLTQTDDILFNGDIWAGQSAVDFGLIDGIYDMYSLLNDRFGENVKLKFFKPKESWLKSKLQMATHVLIEKITDILSSNKF